MRDLLDHADLAGYAGQFVWLELSYDALENRAFLTKYGAEATPTFFVIAPQDEQVTACNPVQCPSTNSGNSSIAERAAPMPGIKRPQMLP